MQEQSNAADMTHDEGTWRTRSQSKRSQVNIKGEREREKNVAAHTFAKNKAINKQKSKTHTAHINNSDLS
jgi:hypothetical protein